MCVSQGMGRETAGGLTIAAGFVTALTVVPCLLFQAGMDFTPAYMSMGAMVILSSGWLALRGLPMVALPSLSLAAWLSYVVMISKGCSWQEVLGISAIVSLAGWLLFSLPWGRKLLGAVPAWFRQPFSLGLGLMLIMQGLVQGRLILASPWSVTMAGNFQDPLAYWSLMGIILGAVLLARVWVWALGACFLLIALCTYLEGFWILPEAPGLLPEGMEKVVGQAAPYGSWSESHAGEFALVGLVLLLTVQAESFCVWQASPQGETDPAPVLRGLAGISFLGAWLGCLPLSLSPLSAGAWAVGGRRGMAAAVALAALSVLWLLEPAAAELAKFPAMTAPVLVLAGAQLIRERLRGFSPGALPWEEWLPGLAGILLMALSFDIGAGAGAMVTGRALLFTAAGRGREVGWPLWLLAMLFLVYFLFGDL